MTDMFLELRTRRAFTQTAVGKALGLMNIFCTTSSFEFRAPRVQQKRALDCQRSKLNDWIEIACLWLMMTAQC